ncbi:MAG: cytochrome c-type biosis protein CcmH [Acidimicrobiaceae bacterium]|jgi:cytochrome c-type biogenesis protein CcmH
MALRISYGLMALVLVGALVFGMQSSGSTSPTDRAQALEQTIKCPTCRGQSVAESDAAASKAIRTEIVRRIADGESDRAIRDYFAAKYGEDILLRPTSSGLAGLVWVLPVAVGVLAASGLGFAFWRWRRWGGT